MPSTFAFVVSGLKKLEIVIHVSRNACMCTVTRKKILLLKLKLHVIFYGSVQVQSSEYEICDVPFCSFG